MNQEIEAPIRNFIATNLLYSKDGFTYPDDASLLREGIIDSLGVVELDERIFEIASVDPDHPLTEHKAKGVAEALRRQDMFDEINVELREGEPA